MLSGGCCSFLGYRLGQEMVLGVTYSLARSQRANHVVIVSCWCATMTKDEYEEAVSVIMTTRSRYRSLNYIRMAPSSEHPPASFIPSALIQYSHNGTWPVHHHERIFQCRHRSGGQQRKWVVLLNKSRHLLISMVKVTAYPPNNGPNQKVRINNAGSWLIHWHIRITNLVEGVFSKWLLAIRQLLEAGDQPRSSSSSRNCMHRSSELDSRLRLERPDSWLPVCHWVFFVLIVYSKQ